MSVRLTNALAYCEPHTVNSCYVLFRYDFNILKNQGQCFLGNFLKKFSATKNRCAYVERRPTYKIHILRGRNKTEITPWLSVRLLLGL